MIRYRDARLSDLKDAEELLSANELDCRVFPNDYYERLIGSKDMGIFVVAEDGAKIVGIIYGEFNTEEHWAELIGVAVLEEYRCLGIGSKLIKVFEKIARKNGARTVDLYANVETLANIIERLGYEKRHTYILCRKKL